jgi:catechol 2,3-dioxygenase-like lactoylglutathione lyase family enzyme
MPLRYPLGLAMRYLHSMIRVLNLESALAFFQTLGLREARRQENPASRYTSVFLRSAQPNDSAEVELTPERAPPFRRLKICRRVGSPNASRTRSA